ncbi:MAG: class I SAM-dependent methyltransferase [Nitrospirae bacterium]|nr:class I SAM-dependent methyltransferase [Nitrospirota bacterium]
MSFENRFRGSRELIKARLGIYLPFISPLKNIYSDAQAIDIGCGRGEWLEILGEKGFANQGVDLNHEMVTLCLGSGLRVHEGEALSFLKNIPDQSQAIVSGFHIAEHMPFNDLKALVEESLRVLRPAGLLILETPNPENIVIATSTFYLDPTHNRPIPPQLLAFTCEYCGFKKIKILRLQESAELANNNKLSLLNVIDGVSPDYAVVAQKSATDELLGLFLNAFEYEYGITLEQLAITYSQQVEERDNHCLTLANQLDSQIKAVYNSKSWRITSPLRKLNDNLTWLFNLSKRTGYRVPVFLDNVRSSSKLLLAHTVNNDHSRLKKLVLLILKRFPGLKDRLFFAVMSMSAHSSRARNRCVTGHDESRFPTDLTQIGQHGKMIYYALKAAIDKRSRENH